MEIPSKDQSTESTSGLMTPARGSVLKDLQSRIENVDKHSPLIGVIALKIISLREINTAFGFKEGDEFLHKCAIRVRQVILPDDSMYRIGDNEFIICLSKTLNEGHAILAANKIMKIFDQPFKIADTQITIKAATGIAIFPEHANTPDEILRKALSALGEAVEKGLPYSVWLDYDDYRNRSSLIIETEIKNAIDQNAFEINYQPKIDIKNKTLIGVEALARWSKSSFGFMPPDMFIPIAEKSDLINELTLNIINTALKDAKEWRGIGANLSLAINLSTLDLQENTMVEKITRAINIWEMQPSKLIFEVTESVMMINPEKSLKVLNLLKDQGIRCAIDDFGTGYSSFGYLKKLPVSELKIDKSFVLKMPDDAEGTMIARSIIELAHNFDLSVTAEGIENSPTINALEEMGCDYGQGFYIARPMPSESLKQWMRDSPWRIVVD